MEIRFSGPEWVLALSGGQAAAVVAAAAAATVATAATAAIAAAFIHES